MQNEWYTWALGRFRLKQEVVFYLFEVELLQKKKKKVLTYISQCNLTAWWKKLLYWRSSDTAFQVGCLIAMWASLQWATVPCWQIERFDARCTAWLQMPTERNKLHPSEGIYCFKKLKKSGVICSCYMVQLQITAPWKILVGLVCSRPGYATPYKATIYKRKSKN